MASSGAIRRRCAQAGDFGRDTAVITKPLKFYFAVPPIDGTNRLVVESANPEQPIGQLFTSEAEAWGVADALNDRELKVRLADVPQAQTYAGRRTSQRPLRGTAEGRDSGAVPFIVSRESGPCFMM
jgi:hypothetical protein